MLLGLLLALAGGLVAGTGTLAALTFLGRDDVTRESIAYVTPPVEASGFVTTALLVLVTVMHSGRNTQSGSHTGALLLVPRRRVLLTAKAVAVAVVAGTAALVATAVTAVAAVAVAGSATWAPHALLAVVAATTAAALVTPLSLFVAVILNRAVPALLVVLALWLLLPTALGVAATAAPAPLAGLAAAASQATPASLLGLATTVSTTPVDGYGGLALGLVGLVVWAGALGVLTASVFSRRSL